MINSFIIRVSINYIPKNDELFVARIGIFLVVGIMIPIIAISMYMLVENDVNIIRVSSTDTVTIGPVEYTVAFDETHNGDKDTKPENTFLQVKITAKNINNEETVISGGQFYIIKDNKRYNAVFGEFSPKDLTREILAPEKALEKTTQFDIAFDEQEKYEVIIKPLREHSTSDTAIVCITNC